MIPVVVYRRDDPSFVRCLPPVLIQEGGNDDDPHDPGGRTSRGIIQREYNAYRDHKGLQRRDVWQASDAEVQEIYYMQYWEPWCPRLWPGVDLMYFDQAVNQGAVQGTRNLQRALGNVAVDGHLGLITLGAVNAVSNRAAFLKAYLAADLSFYRRLVNWVYYGRGWTRRANEIYAQAARMV
jgi:lysozyme family protein